MTGDILDRVEKAGSVVLAVAATLLLAMVLLGSGCAALTERLRAFGRDAGVASVGSQ